MELELIGKSTPEIQPLEIEFQDLFPDVQSVLWIIWSHLWKMFLLLIRSLVRKLKSTDGVCFVRVGIDWKT
jgi:hypothetical protein